MSVDFMVNGELCSWPKGTSLADLIVELKLSKTHVTTRINRKMLLRKDWRQEIHEGDRIEINLSVPHSCMTTPQEEY